MVRLDSALLLGHLGTCTFSLERALLTIKYLYKARAKVVIVTSWDTVLQSDNPEIKSIDSFAGLPMFIILFIVQHEFLDISSVTSFLSYISPEIKSIDSFAGFFPVFYVSIAEC